MAVMGGRDRTAAGRRRTKIRAQTQRPLAIVVIGGVPVIMPLTRVLQPRLIFLPVPPQAAPPGELTPNPSLHAEHAELRRSGNRRVQRGGYSERQRVAGFDRIEHAVVP